MDKEEKMDELSNDLPVFTMGWISSQGETRAAIEQEVNYCSH